MTAGMAAILRAAAVAGLVAVAAAPGGALALKCDRTDNDRIEANRVLRGIGRDIDEMEASIVEALRLQTGQLSGYQAQGTKAVIQALDAQTRLQAQTVREAHETRSKQAHRPVPHGCAAVTGLAGLAPSRAAAATAHGRATDVETARIANDPSVVAAAGSAADTAARFDAMVSTHCSAARMTGDAAVCGGDAVLHAADLRPANLFDRSTFRDRRALHTAIELSRNLAAPVVHDPLPLASAGTDQERRRVLLGRAADARTALASDYFAHARSLRAPGADLGAWAAAVVPSSGRDPARPVSRYELIETLASRRFDDPNWFVGLQAMPEAALLRELVTLQALSLMLDWERFRLDERRGAMDAARLGIATEDMRRLPGLANPGSGTN